MGCHSTQKRTDFTTTSTARIEKMIVIFASTLGKGRNYQRASDRWETSYAVGGVGAVLDTHISYLELEAACLIWGVFLVVAIPS